MKRSIWFWLYFIVAIGLAIYFATRIIMVISGYGVNSYVRNISISADSKNKDLNVIATAAAIAPATNSYTIDLQQVKDRIRAVPGVKEAAIRRKPDGNLSIKVQLYEAIALWTDGENYFPISADGTIVNKPRQERDENSVVFRGPVPNDISEITKAAHNLLSDLDYMEWIEGRRWNLHTSGDITVLLPEKNPADAIGSLIVLNKNHKILSKKLTTIDMRDSSRILVK